jgi:catalase
MADPELDRRLVEAANANYGEHRHRRALHAKGSWARGSFTATPAAAALCRAAPFQGAPVEALARFSNASGDPEADDAEREGRGVGVKLRSPGAETDILATTSPTFLTRTPEEFLELLELRRPDPATGEPNMERLGAFLGEHPEALPAIQAVLMKDPLASFATVTYFSPHAFGLVDDAGRTTWVRYRLLPEAGERRITDDEARALGRDYLHSELAERLGGQTVAFELWLQLAEEGDPLEDPTVVWPQERELVQAGRLELSELVADPETGGHIEVFDPTRVAEGIELSADPILHARPRAYSVSAYKRLD